MYQEPQVQSSYRINNIGKVLYDLVIKLEPTKIIDFGVLHGYSAMAMGQALRDLGKGELTGYDLFESYPYNHAIQAETQSNIDRSGLVNIITLSKKELFSWIKKPEPFDLLHLDVSNDGQIVSDVYLAVKDQVETGSTLVFEGGTKDRDKVPWMKKYHKQPIYPLKRKLGYTIVDERFPGLSFIKT